MSDEPRGRLRTFVTVCAGQVASIYGSHLTAFALGVWVYQRTGSATQFAFISLFTVLPEILLSPLAGVLVDRWNPRLGMIFGDLGGGLVALVLALLAWSGQLQVWHVYPLVAAGAVFSAFQGPAFAAATTLLVPRHYLTRANGVVEMATAGTLLAAPLLAVVLLESIGLAGVILVDMASFLLAFATLLFLPFPRITASAASEAARGSLLAEARLGWSYVRERPGLIRLLVMFTVTNFSFGMVQVLLTPLVLSFASAEKLSWVLTVATAGMLTGGLVISVWAGPRRKVRAILLCFLTQGAILLLGGARPSLLLIATAAFAFTFCEPIILACSKTLWQLKTPLDLQGRVQAIRQVIAWSALPLAYGVAGPLADGVFEPLLAEGGLLASSLGSWIGVGPGRGVGLLFMVVGVLNLIVLVMALRSQRLLRLETDLPDAVDDPAPP